MLPLPFSFLPMQAPARSRALRAALCGALLALLAATATGQEAATAAVRGTVLNAVTGQPVARALVNLSGPAMQGVLTDGEGRFEIPEVPAGRQPLLVHKPGYRDSARDVPGQLPPTDTPVHMVSVTPGMAALTLRLAPTNSLYGQIQLSTGEPPETFTVELLQRGIVDGRAVWQFYNSTKTDSQGRYRFAGLTDGQFLVRTVSVMEDQGERTPVHSGTAPRRGFVGLYYPEARALDQAERIELAHGEQREANFLLTPEPFHAITVAPLLPNGAAGQPTGILLDLAGNPLDLPVGFDAATHTLQMLAPDGVYALLVRSAPPRNEFDTPGSVTVADPAKLLAAQIEFTVAGQPLSRLPAPLAPPPSVALEIHFDRPPSGDEQQDVTTLRLQPVGGVLSEGPSNAETDELHPGLNALSVLPSGSYWMQAELNTYDDSSVCVRSFTAGAANPAHEPIRMGYGATATPLRLEITSECARLELELPDVLTEPQSGDEPVYTAYVIPDADTVSVPDPVTLHAGAGHRESFEPDFPRDFSNGSRPLTPGSYRVYLFRGQANLEFRNRAAIARLNRPGQPVTLTAGATTKLRLEIAEK